MFLVIVIWISFLILVISTRLCVHFYADFVNQKNKLDEKILEVKSKEADQYEIAFIKGGRREVFQLAFYALIKSGYLLALDKEDKESYSRGRFCLDKKKDLNALHEFEKVVALSYDKYASLPDDPEEFGQVGVLFKGYERKIKELALLSPEGYLEPWWSFVFITLCVINLLYGMYINSPAFSTIFLSVINVLTFIVIKRLSSADRLSCNGKRYIELFEINHFPYPDFRKELTMDVEMITPCSL